ncbi:hypothetical protein RQM59_04565 [Flavobacteriaceae bacterium S356]|uniref:DUF1579 domain-containing protein n=1 Tax=Asprobacillus argus TaxID=3076534 RepID=A0ABU3LEM0_9FLAO|nr:hypothetical protein [Flavobacteriaceae bacterium S356]
MKNFYTGLLLLFLTSNMTAQNNSEDTRQTLLKEILGRWEGKGTLMGNQATFQMQWNTALNNKFVQLTFSNTFTDKQGITRTLASKAYYNLNTKKGVWIDSRGMILPLALDFTTDTLTVLWGDAHTEQGKTIYKVADNDIQTEDYVLKNEQYFLFGRASYVRK